MAIYGSEDPDPHSHMASAICGRQITKADKAERAVGKTANFCPQYGGLGGSGISFPRHLAVRGLPGGGSGCLLWLGTDLSSPCKVSGWVPQGEPWEVTSPMGQRMAGHRLRKGELGLVFSGAVPARLKSQRGVAPL